VAKEANPTVFYASRPRLRVDGTQIDDLGDVLLQSLLVEETTLGLFRCEANFTNWGTKNGAEGFLFFERDVLDFGKTIAVEFGPPNTTGPVFAGRISGLEASFPAEREPEFLILAEDRFQDLRMERRTRCFEDLNDADIIRQVASQQGLTAQVDVDGPTYRVVAQVNQSDLAFLRERAAAVDADLWLDDRTLYVQARARRSQGTVSFTYGKDLLEFNVLADLAHQRTTVRVSGWDVAEKDAIDVEAGASVIQAELNGGTGGSTLLDALAPRNERIALATPLSRDEAQTLAESRFRMRARSFVRGQGLVDGNARLRVGTTVELNNVGPIFNGPYYVTLARHSFDPLYGYRTQFHAERPGIGG
jgi:hypothetical protein